MQINDPNMQLNMYYNFHTLINNILMIISDF